MKNGDRVVVVEDPDGLVVGWHGVVLSANGSLVTVWLDDDYYSSTWHYTELELLDN